PGGRGEHPAAPQEHKGESQYEDPPHQAVTAVWRLLEESNTRPASAPREPGVARRAAPARASAAGGIRSPAGKVERTRAKNGSSGPTSRSTGRARRGEPPPRPSWARKAASRPRRPIQNPLPTSPRRCPHPSTQATALSTTQPASSPGPDPAGAPTTVLELRHI